MEERRRAVPARPGSRVRHPHEERISHMTATITPLTKRPAWKALEAHYKKIRELHLRKLFADDPKRGERMTVEAAGIYLDYSKNRITDETLTLLLQLAEESGLRARIETLADQARQSSIDRVAKAQPTVLARLMRWAPAVAAILRSAIWLSLCMASSARP